MSSGSFDSFSQNGEDVVLWRALRGVERGRYIDVGANHPSIDSVSKAFYERGWSGITIEPDPAFARLQREQRPRDIIVECAVTAEPDGVATLHVVDDTGLSTLDDDYAELHAGVGYEIHDLEVSSRRLDGILDDAGWQGRDIHFMSVDTEGFERDVLDSADLTKWRPWVLVVEATEPNSTRPTRDRWEHIVTGAGYRFCLFDGLSCYYVADEHAGELAGELSYAACFLDDYTTLAFRAATTAADSVPALVEDAARWRDEASSLAEEVARLRREASSLIEGVARWRSEATSRWAAAMADRGELEALRSDAAEWRERYYSIGSDHHELSQRHHALHLQVAEIHRSTSWRVTEPLRRAKGILSKPPPDR